MGSTPIQGSSEGKPWASGPREILEHGISLLRNDNDCNRRLAMISIDNAVELMIKTYLGLPQRITGINVPRREFGEMYESFPGLLRAMEQYAAGKLVGVDLGELEWYHRLRNELYHQGNGLTVERTKVEVYAELAKVLFRNLFDVSIEAEVASDTSRRISQFIDAWSRVEKALVNANASGTEQDPQSNASQPFRPEIPAIVSQLLGQGEIDRATAAQIDYLRKTRNNVIHGQVETVRRIPGDTIQKANDIIDRLQRPSRNWSIDELRQAYSNMPNVRLGQQLMSLLDWAVNRRCITIPGDTKTPTFGLTGKKGQQIASIAPTYVYLILREHRYADIKERNRLVDELKGLNLYPPDLDGASVTDGRNLTRRPGEFSDQQFTGLLEVLSHYCRLGA